MKMFMDENFLLDTITAKVLYRQNAKVMPIFDSRCNLDAKGIWENKGYANITQAWLSNDEYKWRAMRLFGISEEYITGTKSDREKFNEYAKMMPYLAGNPLYHLTHLELSRYFSIDINLCEQTAERIWNITKDKFALGYGSKSLMGNSNVNNACTIVDAIDTLEYHKKIEESNKYTIKALPTFSADNLLSINKGTFATWIGKLGSVCGANIGCYEDLLACLRMRLDFFAIHGCIMSDVDFSGIEFIHCEYNEVDAIFKDALNGQSLSKINEAKYKTYTMLYLASEYNRLGWTMQLHVGALKGQSLGFNGIDDEPIAKGVGVFLDKANQNGLPKTIIHSSNSNDIYTLGAMMAKFVGGAYGSRVQLAIGWGDGGSIEAIKQQIKIIANIGALPKFIGLISDSKCLLSYSRHDYFRRILCNLLGEWVENGQYPNKIESLGKMVEDICYNNLIGFINSK